MTFLESLVLLLFAASLLLTLSRRVGMPYPTLLALAGVLVALLPFAPEVTLDPATLLALLIAPVLLDAAYDTSPRELWRIRLPLIALAVGAVLATTAAVALVGVQLGGLGVAAAVTLGAIVAPPDAAAATAILKDVGFPRRTAVVLKGESLLNDATALLLFGAGAAFAADQPARHVVGELALAAPGGVLLGLAMGVVSLKLAPLFAGTLSAIIFQFTLTYGNWLLATRLGLSPVLAIVACAMFIARHGASRQAARDRVQSDAVWAAAVFLLNVIAFLFMGLQARGVIAGKHGEALTNALVLAGAVLATVIVVRLAWVLAYRAIVCTFLPAKPGQPAQAEPTWRLSLLIGWSGMRGLLTVATALGLPAHFPGRDRIVLAAFAVVLGTLVLQGMTLKPLMRWLRITPEEDDDGFPEALAHARRRMLAAGLATVRREPPEVAAVLVPKLEAACGVAASPEDPQGATAFDRGTTRAVEAQRTVVNAMRDRGEIDEDVYFRLREELDWLELAARPNAEISLREV